MNPYIRNRIGKGLDGNFATELHELDENIDVGEVNFFLQALANNLVDSDEEIQRKFKDLIGEGKPEDYELTEKNEIYRAILIQYYTHDYTHEIEVTQFGETVIRVEGNQGELITPRQYFDNYAFDALQNLKNLRDVDVDLQIWVAEKAGQLDSLKKQIEEEIERTGFLKKENFKFKVNDLLAEQTSEQKAERKQKRIEFLIEDLTKDLKQDQSFLDEAGDLNEEGLNEPQLRIEKEARAQEEREIRAEEETRSLVGNLVRQIKDENAAISDEDLDARVSEMLLKITKDIMLRGVLERMMEERAKGSYVSANDSNYSFDPIADYRPKANETESERLNKLEKKSLIRKDIRKTIVEVAQDINRVNAFPFVGREAETTQGSGAEAKTAQGSGAEAEYTLAQVSAARIISGFFEQRGRDKAATNIQKVWRSFFRRINTSAFQGTENADAEDAIGKAGIVAAALRKLDGYTDHKGHWIELSAGYNDDEGNWVDLAGKTLQERLEDSDSTEHHELIGELAKNTGSILESFADFYRIWNLIKNLQTEMQDVDAEAPKLLGYEERIYNKLLKQMPGLEFVFSQIEKYDGNTIPDSREKSPNLKSLYKSKGFIDSPTKEKEWERGTSPEDLPRVKLLKSANQIRKWAGANRFEPIERDIEDLQGHILRMGEEVNAPNSQTIIQELYDQNQELGRQLQQLQGQLDQLNNLSTNEAFQVPDMITIERLIQQLQTERQQTTDQIEQLRSALNEQEALLRDSIRILGQGLEGSIRDAAQDVIAANNRQQPAAGNGFGGFPMGMTGAGVIQSEINVHHHYEENNTELHRIQERLRELNQSTERQTQLLEERIQAAVRNALETNNRSLETDAELLRIKESLGALSRLRGELSEDLIDFLTERLNASDQATTDLTDSLNQLRDLVGASATREQLDEAVALINQSIAGPGGVQETLLERINFIDLAQTAALQEARTNLEDRLTQLRTQLTDAAENNRTNLEVVRDALQLELGNTNRALTEALQLARQALEDRLIQLGTQLTDATENNRTNLEAVRADLELRLRELGTQLTDATAEQARQLQGVRDALELELAGVNRALEISEAQRAIDARSHEDNLRDTESRLKTGLDSMFASLTSDNEALREQIEKQREESKKKERESLDPEGLRKLIAEGVLRDNLMPTIMGGAAGATLTGYGEPIFSYSGIEAGNLLMSHANAAFDNWDTSARDENSTYTSLTGKQRNPLISIAKLENRPVPGGDVPVYCVLKVDHEGVGQTFISEATFAKEIDKPLAEMHAKKTKSVKEAFASGKIPSLEDSLLDGVVLGSPEERLMKKIYDKVSKENALAAEVEADKALKAQYQEIIEGIAALVFDKERAFRLDLLNKGKFKELHNSLVDGNGDFREDLFLGHEDEFADKLDNLNIRRNGQSVRDIDRHYQGIINLVDDVGDRARLQAFLDEPTRDLGQLLDELTQGPNGVIRLGLFADHDQMVNAQILLTKIKFGEDGLTKLMQQYSEQNYPIILKTLEEEHQRLDNVIKDKERNLRTQGETDFVKDKYKKIIDMMADRPLKEDLELVLQEPNGVDLVFDKLFELDRNTREPAHGCIFSDPDIITRFNALDFRALDFDTDKEQLCRDAVAAIDTNRPSKLQMLERLNRDENIADLLFDSTRDARGTVTYTNPKYEGLFDQVVLDIPIPRITGIVDNSATAVNGLTVVPPAHGVPDNITKFQNIIDLMAERPSRADFGSILLNKGADELLQQLFEKDNLDNYANRCVFNAGAAAGIIAEYEALVDPLRLPAANPAEKQAFCQRAIAEVDIHRPTKRQMQNLLDRGNFADIHNALFNGAGNPIYLNLFETIDRDNPIPTITNVVNRDVNVGDLARSSVNPVEKAAHVANFMGSRGAQVERAKQVELQTAIERIKGYPARVVAGDMTPINHDELVTNVLKDNKLVDKVAQESANKVSAVYNEGFFANRAEIAKIRTQEGAALNPEEKRRMLEKSSALGSVLDLKFESSTFQGTSFLRPSRNQFSVMFNGDFGVAGSGNKCGFTQDIAYVPVPGGHKAFMRARVCTSDNLEARTRTGKDGPETYYVLSVYKKGVLSEEEHRVGDVVMDYDTVFHLTKRKDGTPHYEPVSLGSVKESVFQGAAKTFNLVKGAATLLVPSILKPENVDSSIKGEQEFGKREFAEIRQTVKNMQVLIGSTGNEGERAFSTMAQGEVINHTHGRRTYVKTFLRPGYDNSVRVHDRTAFAKDGDRLEFKFDKDGNLSGGVTDDTIRITENGATHDYRGSSRFVDSKYLKMLGVNADIELLGKVSVVSHAVGGNGTDKAGDVVFSHEIFYKTLEAGREVILPVFERGTTTPTEVFKIHLREQMLAKDPTAVPPPTISDEDIRQKLEEMQNKFLGSASVSVSIKPCKAALDHTAAIEGGEWKLHAVKYDAKARDSVVEVEAGRNGIANSALKMDLLQALASQQARDVTNALAALNPAATDDDKEDAKKIQNLDTKDGLDALRTGIGAASKKEIANLNKGIFKTPPVECVLRGKAKPLPEIVTTKKHSVFSHAGRAMSRAKNNIALGLVDESGFRRT